ARGIATQAAVGAPVAPGPVRTRFRPLAPGLLATGPASARTVGRSREGTRFARLLGMLMRKLVELAREYHELHSQHEEHAGDGRTSGAYRRIGHKMGEIADRFERLVERWVHESWLAEA